MAWISIFLLAFSVYAQELPKFLTKHSTETLRYITMDGRFAYVTKKSGVLGMVSSFRSVDFIAEPAASDFLVKASRFKQRIAIEAVPFPHDEMSFLKNHKILVADFGSTVTREVGKGRSARLHVNDEWITFYDVQERMIRVLNLVTQKKFDIAVSKKANPFFIPQVEMVNGRSLVYTDINESGFSALVSYDLETLKSNIVYKSPQNATRLELCQHETYLAVGEFPYDGVTRGSKISIVPFSGSMNLSGLNTLYSSVEQDIGNMVCLSDRIFFVKTLNHNKELNQKTTEAVMLTIKTQAIEARSMLKTVAQLIEMDNRVLIPFRGEFLVLEGRSNLGEDVLKNAPPKEELELDI